MRDTHKRHELAAAMEDLSDQLRDIADFENRRTALTATASAYDGLVRVTVNADGQLVDTYFDEGITTLSAQALAAAVTAAAKTAAIEVFRHSEELRAPFMAQRGQRPTLSEILAGIPDIEAGIRKPTKSLTVLAAEREEAEAPAAMPETPASEVRDDPGSKWQPAELSDVDYDYTNERRDSRDISDHGWG